jgi:hypothetical protein
MQFLLVLGLPRTDAEPYHTIGFRDVVCDEKSDQYDDNANWSCEYVTMAHTEPDTKLTCNSP